MFCSQFCSDSAQTVLRASILTGLHKLPRMFSENVKINPLNTELNSTCLLLALLGAHHILHVGRIRIKASLCETALHGFYLSN